MSADRRRVKAIYTTITSFAVLCLVSCGSTLPAQRVSDNPRSAYEWALDKLDRGKCLDARETLRLLSLESGGVPYIDSIVYNLAQAYMCSHDYVLAQMEFERIVNRHASSALVDDAAFGSAFAQFKQAPRNPGLDQQVASKAVSTLEDFIAIYPRSNRREEADNLLYEMRNRLAKKAFDTGRLYLKLHADTSAMIYFQQIWDEYTESPYAARALWLLAEKARENETWDMAIMRYEQLITVYPNSIEVERSSIFLGRIRADRARTLFASAEQYRRDQSLQEALDTYETILDQYPEFNRIKEVLTRSDELREQLEATDPGGSR